MTTTMIKQYIRKGGKWDAFGNRITKGRPIGVLVAIIKTTPDGKPMISFGWSLCDARDEFNRDYGTQLAVERIYEPVIVSKLPHAVQKALVDFEKRAFKVWCQ